VDEHKPLLYGACMTSFFYPVVARWVWCKAGGVLENKHSTDVGCPPPPPRVCTQLCRSQHFLSLTHSCVTTMSIHPEGKSDIGLVVILNDPGARTGGPARWHPRRVCCSGRARWTTPAPASCTSAAGSPHCSTSHLNRQPFCHSNHPIYPTHSAYVELKSGRVYRGFHSSTSHFNCKPFCYSNHLTYPTKLCLR